MEEIFFTATVLWKYAHNFYTINPRVINYNIISKCSSQILPSFQFQLSGGTWLPKLLHTIESITITSHTNLFSFTWTFIFRSFDSCWRSGEENHTRCDSLKLHTWQKLDQILQLKSSVDLMQATAKIHSQVTTTTSCKKHWSSPGAKSLNCRECLLDFLTISFLWPTCHWDVI